MQLLAPDYYQDFSCIAGACRHSCCVGWEIDIDPASVQRYQKLEGALEQVGVYFLYRHLPGALEDGAVGPRAAFAALSVELLRGLCALHHQTTDQVTLDDLVEYARMYSGEIEYSEDNLAQVLRWLTQL